MIDLLEALFGPFIPSLEGLLPYVPYVIGALIALALIVRFGVPFVLAFARRIVTRTPRSLFKAKATLLAHRDICEMYAPANQYMTDREDGKNGGAQFAWLSPFERAVRTSIKRNPVSRNRKFNARAQVREAAKHITVRKPHPADNVAGDLAEHFRIDMKLDGHDAKEIEKLEGRVTSQLGLHSVAPLSTSDNYTMSVIAHKTEPIDILIERKQGVEFIDANPAKSPLRLPIAVTESGAPWNFDVHHTLLFGMSGSGKGSPIQASIRQLAPFVAQGLVKIHGIDPKKAEFKGYEVLQSSLFEKITSGLKAEDMEEHGAHIAELLDIVDQRQGLDNVSVKEGDVDLGRAFNVTKETPLVVVFIDEYLTLYRGFQKMGRNAKVHLANLEQLMSVARSFNVYVVAATQRASADVLEELRPNITNWIILRQRNKHFNEVFLGDDSIELGHDSRLIGPSSPANGYLTSGIGYAADETGDPIKIRFAYLGDEDVAQLIRDFERDHGRGDITEEQFSEFEEVMDAPALSDDYLFGGKTAEQMQLDDELPDLEDDFGSLPDLEDDKEVDA